jgi:hypothetical protein
VLDNAASAETASGTGRCRRSPPAKAATRSQTRRPPCRKRAPVGSSMPMIIPARRSAGKRQHGGPPALAIMLGVSLTFVDAGGDRPPASGRDCCLVRRCKAPDTGATVTVVNPLPASVAGFFFRALPAARGNPCHIGHSLRNSVIPRPTTARSRSRWDRCHGTTWSQTERSGHKPATRPDRLGRSCRVGPGNFTPSRSQNPDLTLSRHPARAIARRLPPSIERRAPPVAG